VIAADVQPQMLKVLKKRAEKAGVSGRIVTVCCANDKMRVSWKVDFALVNHQRLDNSYRVTVGLMY